MQSAWEALQRLARHPCQLKPTGYPSRGTTRCCGGLARSSWAPNERQNFLSRALLKEERQQIKDERREFERGGAKFSLRRWLADNGSLEACWRDLANRAEALPPSSHTEGLPTRWWGAREKADSAGEWYLRQEVHNSLFCPLEVKFDTAVVLQGVRNISGALENPFMKFLL